MPCEHDHLLVPGPRIEMRWGTGPTQICAKCGAWRSMLHVPGPWRTEPLPVVTNGER